MELDLALIEIGHPGLVKPFPGFMMNDLGYPIFAGEGKEQHSGAWTQLKDAGEYLTWHKAAIAMSVHEKWKKDGIEEFCKAHSVKESYVYQLIRTYKRFASGKCTRVQSLSFSHHRTASYVKDPEQAQEWLHQADDRKWSHKIMQDEIRKDRGRQKIEAADNPDLEVERQYWHSTIRPVLCLYIRAHPNRKQMVASWLGEGDANFKMRVMTHSEMVLQKLNEGCETIDDVMQEMSWDRDMAQAALDDLVKAKKAYTYEPEKTTYMARGAVTTHYKPVRPPDSDGEDFEESYDDLDDD